MIAACGASGYDVSRGATTDAHDVYLLPENSAPVQYVSAFQIDYCCSVGTLQPC